MHNEKEEFLSQLTFQTVVLFLFFPSPSPGYGYTPLTVLWLILGMLNFSLSLSLFLLLESITSSTQGGLSVHLSITLRLSLFLFLFSCVFIWFHITTSCPAALLSHHLLSLELSHCCCSYSWPRTVPDNSHTHTHTHTHTHNLTEVRPFLWRTRQVVQSLLSFYFSSSSRPFVVCFSAIKQRSPSFSFSSFFEALFFPFLMRPPTIFASWQGEWDTRSTRVHICTKRSKNKLKR